MAQATSVIISGGVAGTGHFDENLFQLTPRKPLVLLESSGIGTITSAAGQPAVWVHGQSKLMVIVKSW